MLKIGCVQFKLMFFLLITLAFISNETCHAAVKNNKTKSKLHQKRLKINPLTDTDGAWVVNLETDVYQLGTFENLTAGYSASDGWDISLSLLNTQVSGNRSHFQGNTFLNIAKTFDVNKDYSITVGVQNGIALADVPSRTWFNFDFLDNRYDVLSWFSIHAGPYLANAAITGKSRHVGFLTGVEFDFIANKLSLQMDYISGHHSLSGANINLLYNITPRWQIYLGVLVPETHSGNEFAGIIGFNLSTHKL